MFDEVEARLARLNVHRPFDEGMIARLDAVFEQWFIYGSNALEGNTLTLGDTIYLIREGRLPGGKREEEYLEVKGQQAAYSYLRQAAVGKFPLSEKLIREFHQLLTEIQKNTGPGSTRTVKIRFAFRMARCSPTYRSSRRRRRCGTSSRGSTAMRKGSIQSSEPLRFTIVSS